MKIVSIIIAWIAVAFLLVFLLVESSIVSKILLFIAAVAIAPIKQLREMLGKWHLKGWMTTVFAVVLFFAAILASPSADAGSDKTAVTRAAIMDAETQETQAPTNTPEPTVTPKPTETPEPAATPTATPEPTDMPEPTEAPTPTPVPEHDYVINTNTGKFHKPTCSSVGKIKESNRWDYHGTYNDVISMGYEPCKRCKPS